MTKPGRSESVVIQCFYSDNAVPAWIQRCIDSVRRWAELRGHDYLLAGVEFVELCGPEYLARGNKNPQAITNLARLVATRKHLDAGYQRVIWMDADVFVFDPVRLVLDFPDQKLSTGYAFGREVWVYQDFDGALHARPPDAHNAATYFTCAAVDLDVLISLIRHIDASRKLVSNYQIGTRLLHGLHYSLMFPTFTHVAMFAPALVQALAEHDEKVLRFYSDIYRYQSCAANLCQYALPEDTLWRAMDHLEESAGDVINQYASRPGMHLVPYEDTERPLISEMPKTGLRARLRSLATNR